MYFVKTPSFKIKPDNEQALRERIESERRELYTALKKAGIENPPVELSIESSRPRPDCIFFPYREGLIRGLYNAETFAKTFASHNGINLEKIKEEAARSFEQCPA